MHSRRAFFGLIGIGAALAPFAKAIASVGPETAKIADMKIESLRIGSNGVTISTTKTLSEWRNGSDVTVIDGGRINTDRINSGYVVFGPPASV